METITLPQKQDGDTKEQGTIKPNVYLIDKLKSDSVKYANLKRKYKALR